MSESIRGFALVLGTLVLGVLPLAACREDGPVTVTALATQPPATATARAFPIVTPTLTQDPPPTAGPSPATSPPPTPTTACVASQVADPTASLLLAVDREQALPDGYAPPVVPLPEHYTIPEQGQLYLIAEARDGLVALLDGANTAGHEILVLSAYRSYEAQQRTFARWVSELGEEQAQRESARPGHSEHQLGQAADLTSAAVGWDLVPAFGETPAGQWVETHLHEYGFALSYPRGGEPVTGYLYEPWHIRYVGPACATEWQASGLTLIEVLRGEHLNR